MRKKQKELAQIAYEASESGGKQNWGSWHKAPSIVREVHRKMAKSVEIATKRRLIKAGWLSPKRKEEYAIGVIGNQSC